MSFLMLRRFVNNQPEENEEQETVDFNKPDYVFVPKGNHEWRQKGPYLECKTCEIHHAVYVGVHKRMVGVDDKGNPILQKV